MLFTHNIIIKKILIRIATFILLAVILTTIDVHRFNNNKKPYFTFYTKDFHDGGTSSQYGLGYQLIDWHILRYDEEKETSYYLTRRDVRYFPFFTFSYSTENIDENDFRIIY